MTRGRKRRHFLSREELGVQSKRARRQKVQVRAMELQRDTEAHQIVRQDPEISEDVPPVVVKNQSEAGFLNPETTEDVPPVSVPVYDPKDIGYGVQLRKDGKLNDQSRARFLNVWIPPEKYKEFASVLKHEPGRSVSKRSFNHSHITGINSCFAYSAKDSGIYCKSCVLFAPCNESTGAFKVRCRSIVKTFISEAFTNATKSGEKLRDHLCTQFHADADLMRINFEQNRLELGCIFRAINWLARQGLPLCSHPESGPLIPSEDGNGAIDIDHTRGNFHALLQLLAEDDHVLRDHLNKSAKNAKYICPESQNHMLQAMGNVLTVKLVEQINAAQYMAVIADETTDTSHKEQMVVCIRFVDQETMDIREKYLCFVHISDLSAAGISEKIIETLPLYGLTCQIVGQGYDGASVMSSQFAGVQQRVREHHPLAVYVHCPAHNLNIVLQDAAELPSIRSAVAAINELISYIAVSDIRSDELEKHIKELLPEAVVPVLVRFCKMRWVEKQEAVVRFIQLYPAIMATLKTLQGKRGEDGKALNHEILLERPDVLIAAHVLGSVLRITKNLSLSLQSENMDLVECMEEVQIVIDTLERYRIDEARFATMFHTVQNLLQTQLDDETYEILQPRVKANPPVATALDHYRVTIYNSFLDSTINLLKTRFSNHTKQALAMAKLTPRHVCNTDFNELQDSISMYIGKLNGLGLLTDIEAEFARWQSKWLVVSECDRPQTILDSLKMCSKLHFPNINLLLRVLATIPASTATAESAFSQLKLIKTYVRSTMGEDRLNALTQLYVHKDIQLEMNHVLDEFQNIDANKRISL